MSLHLERYDSNESTVCKTKESPCLQIFQHLPIELVHHILSYDKVVNYRNGRYINGICPSRYQVLHTIPRPTIGSIRIRDETRLRLTVAFPYPFKNIHLEKIECDKSTNWSDSVTFDNIHILGIVTFAGGYGYQYIKVKTCRWYIDKFLSRFTLYHIMMQWCKCAKVYYSGVKN